MDHTYAAIDLKSFYASVECVSRGLDPLEAHLVVADESRTEKTICLAVSPALKKFGLSGRSRLWEVLDTVERVRKQTGRAVDLTIAPPRMRKYMAVSASIYEKVYLKYFAPEDIHVYSIDEVFLDLTKYLPLYRLPAREMVFTLMREVRSLTGITATAGIGPNLYLCKIAMDILAKKQDPSDGFSAAELTEEAYRELLWDHRPLTDFWRIGRRMAARLERMGCLTMGDIARRSVYNEESLYREFGVDAELLIDHAWGLETCTMADIHAYTPSDRSFTSGQVLAEPYGCEAARLLVREMAEGLALELAEKEMEADSVVLTIGFDREKVDDGSWTGPTQKDFYGRTVPRSAHGTEAVRDAGGARVFSSAASRITEAAVRLYDRIGVPSLTVRRLNLAVEHVQPRGGNAVRQMDLFMDPAELEREDERIRREEKVQKAMLDIRKKYGKNAIFKGLDLMEGATARQRNAMVGGHAAGKESSDGEV